jgi:hypothetical protein
MFPRGASPYFFRHHQVLHPRSVAWSYNKVVVRESIDKFLDDQLRVSLRYSIFFNYYEFNIVLFF